MFAMVITEMAAGVDIVDSLLLRNQHGNVHVDLNFKSVAPFQLARVKQRLTQARASCCQYELDSHPARSYFEPWQRL